MKFTPSSSVSSSSTTNNNSFRQNFCRSKGNTFGCFSGVLSRILCSKSLPTHPSDPIESNKQQHLLNNEKIVDGSSTPNVVARLMGLDSIPEFDFKVSLKTPSNSIARTKSMDSGDFREETEEMQGQHRTAKTAFSFKETLNYFEVEDDDFFVLSFEDKSEKKKKKKKHRGSREKCSRKQRRIRDEQSKNRVFTNEDRLSLKISARNSQKCENGDDIQNQSYHLPPLKDTQSCRKEDPDGSIARKKKKKEGCLCENKEDEAECDSDNSSPVSVLDHREFATDPEATTSEEDAIPRRDLIELQSDQSNGSSVGQERKTDGNEEKNVGLKRRDYYYRKHDNTQTMNKVFRLAEAEINNSNWKYRGRSLTTPELEDTGKEFGQQIFDELVTELVDLLVELNKCQDL